MSIDTLKRLIDDCSPEERAELRSYFFATQPQPLEKEWGVDADTILTAIGRSSDLTKRGVRGIIAEAVFENSVLPLIEKPVGNQLLLLETFPTTFAFVKPTDQFEFK